MNRELVKKIGIWFLAFSLTAAHLFFRSVADAQEVSNNWPLATTQEFQVAFPEKPHVIQRTMRLGEGEGSLRYDVYLAPINERAICLLLVATYPRPLAAGHEMAGLEGLLKGIMGHHPDNQLVFAKGIKALGSPAIDFLIQSGTNYFRGRALMKGSKLYLLAIEGRKGEQSEEQFQSYFQSFQIK
jgi:hypothetical protein